MNYLFVFEIVLILLAIYFAVPWVYGRYKRLSMKREAIKNKTLSLTYDDGPGSNLTPEILDILKEYNVRVSFFVLGKNISSHEMIIKKAMEAGHSIFSHGFNHLNHWKVSPFKAISDIKMGWNELDRALGLKNGTYPFRPPYGKLSIITLVYLLSKRIPIIFWTHDSNDSWEKISDIDKKLNNFLANPYGVVLLHDYNRDEKFRKQYVLEYTKRILAYAQANNLCN